MKVYAENGVILTNTSRYPFTDPSTGIRYEPGQSVQVEPTEWTESQSVLAKTARAPTEEESAAANKAAEEAAAQLKADEAAATKKAADEKKAAADAAKK